MADDLSEGKIYATFERFADLKKWQESMLNQDLFREPSDEEQKDEDWAEQRFSFTVCPIIFLQSLLITFCSSVNIKNSHIYWIPSSKNS